MTTTGQDPARDAVTPEVSRYWPTAYVDIASAPRPGKSRPAMRSAIRASEMRKSVPPRPLRGLCQREAIAVAVSNKAYAATGTR